VRLVEEIAGVSPGRARRALAAAHGRARLAIAMAGTGLGAREAAVALRKHGGDLRAVLAVSAVGSERARASR
jgi:N-acetylmuramic acid 6-phosphate (MurNAc-6-P) etherase